ncbi:MAG: phage holin family protein [Planctomycetaceae bacterium]|nr:phage holin family protein [Planctomycetaceae bacterium]
MVDQTQINGRRAGTVRQNLAGLAHDAITLAELQCQLFAVDLRQVRRVAMTACAQLAAGAVLALGCLPVLLAAGSQTLIEVWNWPAAAAHAAVGGTALAIAVGLMWLGWRKLGRSLKTMERSRSEFSETLAWLKTSLRASEVPSMQSTSEFPWHRP